MPLETRAPNQFTTGNLLVGFSRLEWQRRLADGTLGPVIDFEVLSSQELAKEVETIEVEDGSSGVLTVIREIVARVQPSLNVEVINFRPELAELIFGSTDHVDVVADAAATITNELFSIPTFQPALTFVPLANGNIDETSLGASAVTCGPIVDEIVGTGDGLLGATDGDFSLDFKPLILADVTAISVGGVAQTIVAGEPAAGEVQVTVGTGVTSGELDFGTVPPAGAAILATYTPSHAFANLTDYIVDPQQGRIRMLNVDGATDALKQGQPMNIDYTYSRAAGVNLNPFTRNSVEGRLTIKHLAGIGSNFRWPIPSASLLLNADPLTFGAEDIIRASLTIAINDAGGVDRYGTMFFANEAQSGN